MIFQLFMERIYPPLGPLIVVFVTATAIAGLNAVILAQSRLASAAAKCKHLPVIMSTLNDKYNMPWASTICLVCNYVFIKTIFLLMYFALMCSKKWLVSSDAVKGQIL